MVLAATGLAGQAIAANMLAQDILTLTEGRRTKLVWASYHGDLSNIMAPYGGSDSYRLMGFDADELVARSRSGHRSMLDCLPTLDCSPTQVQKATAGRCAMHATAHHPLDSLADGNVPASATTIAAPCACW